MLLLQKEGQFDSIIHSPFIIFEFYEHDKQLLLFGPVQVEQQV